jgi:hypothetical protein
LRHDGRGEKSDECSIGRVKRLLVGVFVAVGVGALLAGGRRRQHAAAAVAKSSLADELRAKLAESRAAESRAAESRAAEADPSAAPGPAPGSQEPAGDRPEADEVETDLDGRRREVHERARAAIDELAES